MATVTEVGRYCWRAEYSGDSSVGVPGSSDGSSNECFSVTPVTPTLTTSASGGGNLPTTISDTATLLGTANEHGTGGVGLDGSIGNPGNLNFMLGGPAGGTITFTAFGPDNCTTFASTTRTVSGDGTYPTGAQPPVSFAPTAVGTYTFVATYSGDSPNTTAPATTATCAGPGANETVLVTDTTGVKTNQNWLPNDSAQITSGGSPLNGTVTFTLYNNGTCDAGINNVNVLYTQGPIPIGGSSPQTASTSNLTVKVSASATVSWRVAYTSNTPNVSGSTSSCETTTLAISNNPGF